MQVVAHNLLANFSSRQLKTVTNNKEKNVERLSTGYKINRSSDDAAGLTISEKMRWQIRGLDKCDQNVQDGISLLQVADGAMDEISSMLHRLKELSIQGLNDTNTETDVAAIQQEMNAIVDEIDSIAEKTTFNGIPLLQGDYERVTEKTITTTTEPQTVKMRYTENSILPSWVSVNGVAADQLTGTDAGKMIMNNTQISVGTTQDTTLIKYVSDSTDPTKITEKSNWTPELNDNFAGVIDFSFLSSVNGTTDITVTDDVNGDGNVDASDKISVSNLYLKLSELVNTGFSTQCCTCTEPYGVLFSTKDRISEITEIPGITDGKNNGIQVIYIDDLLDKASNDPTAGQAIAEELVQRMLDEKGGGL